MHSCIIYSVEVDDSIMRNLIKTYLREVGRKGGMVHNPRKGFGSNDNARRAALARWDRVREASKLVKKD